MLGLEDRLRCRGDPLTYFAGRMFGCFKVLCDQPDTAGRTYRLDLLAACTRVLEVHDGAFMGRYNAPEFLRRKVDHLSAFLPPISTTTPVQLTPLPNSAAIVASVEAIYAARPDILLDIVHDVFPSMECDEVLTQWGEFCREHKVLLVNHPPDGLSSVSGLQSYVYVKVSADDFVRVVRHEAAHNFPRWLLHRRGRGVESARRVSPARNDRLVITLRSGQRQVEAGWYADFKIDPAEVEAEAARDEEHLVVGPFSLWQHVTIM